MAIKLYTDEHVVPAVVNALRKQGLDVLTAQEAQMLNAPDEEHLRFAILPSRSIFTQDADFLRLHARQILSFYKWKSVGCWSLDRHPTLLIRPFRVRKSGWSP